MVRTCLIWFSSLALVLVGASGLHGHLSAPHDAENAHIADHAEPHSHAHVVTVFDADHFETHEHQGDVDIDPLAKAFGKGPVLQLFAALLFALGIAWLLIPPLPIVRAVLPPLRPPKVRFRPYLLPPSQAPPSAA
jgi:hypothetical protein